MSKGTDPVEETGNSTETSEVIKETSESTSLSGSKLSMLRPKNLIKKIKSTNRNTRLAILLSAILVVVGFAAFSMTRTEKSNVNNEDTVQEIEQTDSVDAKISLIEGTLQIYKDGEWVDVSVEEAVKPGALFKTVGATSRSVIIFDNGSELRMDANSEIEIHTLSASRIEIKHNSGYTYSRVVKTDGLTYLVVSEDAQYEALGTAFKTTVNGDGQAVEVYQSTVIETSTNKTVKEGEKLIVKSENKPTDNGKVEKLDIEQVKNDPFMQWNRELDLKEDKFKNTLGFLGDLTAPEITINTTDGQTILLEPSASEGSIEFSGTTEKGATVSVQLKGGASKVDAIVDSNGGFKTPVMAAPVGSATFEFTAKDKAGNTTTKSIRVLFQAKSQPVVSNGINLSGNNNDTAQKVELSWVLSGSTSAPDGVKLVYSKSTDPVFGMPGVESIYKETGNSESIKYSKLESGKIYYFKVCIYDEASGTCGLYSNQVKLTIP